MVCYNNIMIEGYQNKQIEGSPKTKTVRKKKSVKGVKSASVQAKKTGKVKKYNFPQFNQTVEASTLQEALSIINNQ